MYNNNLVKSSNTKMEREFDEKYSSKINKNSKINERDLIQK